MGAASKEDKRLVVVVVVVLWWFLKFHDGEIRNTAGPFLNPYAFTLRSSSVTTTVTLLQLDRSVSQFSPP